MFNNEFTNLKNNKMKSSPRSYHNPLYCALLLAALLCSCVGEERPADNEEIDAAPVQTEQAAAWADTAQMKLYSQWDWEGAEEAFQKALELNPDLGRAHAHYGWLKVLQDDEPGAVVQMKQAIAAEPGNPLWPAWHGWMLWSADQKDQALMAAQEALEIDSNFAVAHYVIGSIYAEKGESDLAMEALDLAARDSLWIFGTGVGYARLGQRAQALAVADQLAKTGKTWDIWGLAEIYAVLGDTDRAIEWLEQAYQQRHPYTPWMEWNHNFESLRTDERFAGIVERLELPQGAL